MLGGVLLGVNVNIQCPTHINVHFLSFLLAGRGMLYFGWWIARIYTLVSGRGSSVPLVFDIMVTHTRLIGHLRGAPEGLF